MTTPQFSVGETVWMHDYQSVYQGVILHINHPNYPRLTTYNVRIKKRNHLTQELTSIYEAATELVGKTEYDATCLLAAQLYEQLKSRIEDHKKTLALMQESMAACTEIQTRLRELQS